MKKQYTKPIIIIEELIKRDVLLESGPTEPTTIVINPEATIAKETNDINYFG